MTAVEKSANPPQITADCTCVQCSCLCDDIELTVVNNRITAATNACPIGRQSFLRLRNENIPACRIAGREATFAEGIAEAAKILSTAKRPWIGGLNSLASQAQRAAIAVADRLGGVIDASNGAGRSSRLEAMQQVGESTCFFGEIRHRSKLVIFWRTDPVATHPRFFSRFIDPPGRFVAGRGEREIVVIGSHRTATAQAADRFLQLAPQSDVEAFAVLRMLAVGLEPEVKGTLASTGVPLDSWRELMDRMRVATYGSILYGDEIDPQGDQPGCYEGLLRLVREMHRHTRFVARHLGGRKNAAGADHVLAWQTGYAGCVDFSRGYPRYESNRRNIFNEVDAALLFQGAGESESSSERWQHLPCIVLGREDTEASRRAAVSFITAEMGIESGGTIYRTDGVALPLRPVLRSKYPSDAEVLKALEQALK